MLNLHRIIKESIEKVLKENINDIGYSHYAVLTPINKIVNAWDYEGYSAEELRSDKRYYFIDDIIDQGFNPKDIRIYTKRTLLRMGLDPDVDENWDNGFDYIK
jgi:hypothetical protein